MKHIINYLKITTHSNPDCLVSCHLTIPQYLYIHFLLKCKNNKIHIRDQYSPFVSITEEFQFMTPQCKHEHFYITLCILTKMSITYNVYLTFNLKPFNNWKLLQAMCKIAWTNSTTGLTVTLHKSPLSQI